MKKLFILLAAMLTLSSTTFAQIGSLSSDLVFTPVTPCRLFDTRPSQGGTGPIAAAATRNFLIWGQSSYAAQGGAATNCGLLTAGNNVAAVAVNLTVVTPAAGGFITAYPFGAALPTAATVNFQAGDITRGNFTIAKINQATGSNLSVYSTSNADVVGDVVGYYSRPVSAGSMQCGNTALKTTSIAANSSLIVIANACAAEYVTTSATCDATSYGVYMVGSGMLGNDPANGAYCKYFNTTASAASTYTASTCCRIPGR